MRRVLQVVTAASAAWLIYRGLGYMALVACVVGAAAAAGYLTYRHFRK